jgi:indolepyruvate ferredoxin oxidoreductase
LRRAEQLPIGEPVETELGRKRRIDQIVVQQGLLVRERLLPELRHARRREAQESRGRGFDPDALAARVDALQEPSLQLDNAPYDILITGVGGTGVVTVGALISMAAHLEGKSASVLDFMGFAQKGGAVLSFVRFADHRPAEPGAHRYPAGRRAARLRHGRRREC